MQKQTVHGIYTDAVVYTVDDPAIAVDKYALSQIQLICDNKMSDGSIIRVMPDVHPGKVGPIGLTMTFGERVLPSLVGIDIGCGMSLVRLQRPKLEYKKLDAVIRECIPSGFNIHPTPKSEFDFDAMFCGHHVRQERALCSLGTLGGGNHFIEIDCDPSNQIYLMIHSGSRHLGKEVAEHYLREGQRVLRENGISEPYETTWLEGELLNQYIHDVRIAQEFARLNREIMIKTILKKMKWKAADDIVTCCHNYIDATPGNILESTSCKHHYILRKGAISAQLGEPVIIPIHMKDGVLLGRGKGNVSWNSSAPHGSGRLYKREDVSHLWSVSDYKRSMEGIYSSCIGRSTLDESPFCYRNCDMILDAIDETVEIESILHPLYNYKDNTEANHADTN